MRLCIASLVRASADPLILEALAELEHKQWMAWAKNLLRKEDLSKDRALRWKSLFIPYEDLTKEMKEEDRIYARKVLNILKRNGIKI